MQSSITGVKAYNTRLPLIRPYHLSLVTLEAFESVVVRIQADGVEGFGEATDVPGYYTQSLLDAWEFVARHGPDLLGENPQAALERVIEKGDAYSFAATPLLTALESLIDSLSVAASTSLSLPLLGIVQGETPDDIVADAQRLINDGYTTLKFKVGFEVGDDLNRVRLLQAHLTPGVELRLDANQGYNYSQAQEFLEGLVVRGRPPWVREGLRLHQEVPPIVEEVGGAEDDPPHAPVQEFRDLLDDPPDGPAPWGAEEAGDGAVAAAGRYPDGTVVPLLQARLCAPLAVGACLA